MSKKSNQEKALAKRTQKPKKTRKNPARAMPFLFPPVFGFEGLLNAIFGVRVVPPRSLDAWACDPCGIRVDLLNPQAAPLKYCPKCRGPMHRIGETRPSGTIDPGPNCIDINPEDATRKMLPAPCDKESK